VTPNEKTLFVVVADADVEALLRALLRRGIDSGCLRAFPFIIRREPMRDAGVRQAPLRAVPDLILNHANLLVIVDHHGCGSEGESAEEIEAKLLIQIKQAGLDETHAMVLVLRPELEEVLVPVWDRVSALMAAKRNRPPPNTQQILDRLSFMVRGLARSDEDFRRCLAKDPKACLQALLRVLQLRHQSALYEDIGRAISVAALKEGEACRRLAARLNTWYGKLEDCP